MAVATLLATCVASAHGDGGDACALQARDDAVPGEAVLARSIAPGVTFRLLEDTTGTVLIENTSRHVLLVLDEDGEPFLQIGRKGVVANVRSRAWGTSGACARTTVDRGPSFVGAPSWQRVTRAPRFRWRDARLAHDATGASWRIHAMLDAQAVEIAGEAGRERGRYFPEVALNGVACVSARRYVCRCLELSGSRDESR